MPFGVFLMGLLVSGVCAPNACGWLKNPCRKLRVTLLELFPTNRFFAGQLDEVKNQSSVFQMRLKNF